MGCADDTAPQLDMRWYADVAWGRRPVRTLVGLRCEGQDRMDALSASDVFTPYDELRATLARSAASSDIMAHATALPRSVAADAMSMCLPHLAVRSWIWI